MVEYEARFHKLARHATMILPIEYKRVQCFVRELRLLFCMATQSMIAIGRYFMDINHYA